MPNDKPTPPSGEELRRMYIDERLSSIDIAARYGVNPSTVCKWLRRNGIKARPVGEAGKDGAWKNRGKTRHFTDEWRSNLSKAGKKWGDQNSAGISYKTGGYVEYTRGPNKGRSVHVVLMEQHIGRKLNGDEVVHHIDHNRHNNDISNLRLMTRAEHTRLHRLEEDEGTIDANS